MSERLASGKLLLDSPAEAVVRLRISNPDQRNALDHEILDALAETLPRLDQGIETRCLLIAGAPPVFSAGYDITSIPAETFERDAEALVAHPFHAAMEALASYPWPTVAAINGHCIGGGLELAVTCDMRICAAGAKLGMPPVKLGLVYSHTGLRKFLDVVGVARTKELFLTGRNVDAARAAQIGLVHEVVADAELESRRGRVSGRDRRQRAALDARQQERDRPAQRFPHALRTTGGRPGRPARVLLRLGGLPRGDRGLCREAQARMEGSVSAKASRELAASDPTMAALIERVGKIDIATRLKRRSEERPADAYGALLRAIVGQQLSTKAARTIYGRILELFDGTAPAPEQLLEADEADLRAAGLSGRKVEYVRDLAGHVIEGELELDRLTELSDAEAIEEIVAVRGLGVWTAEMFLIFHLERPDVLSGGDLAIRKAVQIEYGLEEMPTPTRVMEVGEPWSPHRSLASLYLWESLANAPID